MCLDIDEGPSKRTDRPIETSEFGRFKINEKASDPGGEMFLEEGSVSAVGCRNIPTDQACHHLAEKSGMVLRLNPLWRLLDAKTL